MISPDDPRHGERRGYIAGCRDTCCSAAHAAYMADYKARPEWRAKHLRANKASAHRRHMLSAAGINSSQHRIGPVREHVAKVMSIGWSGPAIAAIHGSVSKRLVWEVVNVEKDFVHAKTADLMLVPYTLHVPACVADEMMVPYLGAKRRTEAVMAFGWSRDLQVEHGAPSRVCIPQMSITAKRWRQIDAVFQELASTRGPSRVAEARARSLGYLPAAAWDDIDDPSEDPAAEAAGDLFDEVAVLRRCSGDKKVPLTEPEYVEVVRRLHYVEGLSFKAVEMRAGVNVYRYKKAAAEAHAAVEAGYVHVTKKDEAA